MHEDKYMTFAQVAAALGTCEQTVRCWCSRQTFPSPAIVGKFSIYLWDRADIEAWADVERRKREIRAEAARMQAASAASWSWKREGRKTPQGPARAA